MLEEGSRDLATVIDEINAAGEREGRGHIGFARAVHAGLSARPRLLESQYLYDARGSELFEEICEQPEYYPTRTEAAILRNHSAEIAEETGPLTVMELGAGTAQKTEHLLRAYHSADALHGYVAVDVSASALEKGRAAIGSSLPTVDFHALCATYDAAFSAIGRIGRTMLVFLGSTIGNFPGHAMTQFFEQVAVNLKAGEFFLLGVDLHKDVAVLEAAYNDAAGVTADFTLNLFARMNRELGAGIDLACLRHRAHYNSARQQIEIYAEFTRAQRIRIEQLNLTHQIDAGERIQTEVSRKFTVDGLARETARHGLACRRVYRDGDKRFALVLFEREAV